MDKSYEHCKKVLENIIKKRIRSETSILENQFNSFLKKFTMEPLFWVRKLEEKYRKNNKKQCEMFIDLEKAYDRVPRKYIKWTLIKKRSQKYI